MEQPVVRKRGRPRKRRRDDSEDATDDHKMGSEAKKLVWGTKPVALLGRYVLKEFEGIGTFLGKVVCYTEGLYRINYEDGDFEDLESGEIRGILLVEDGFDHYLNTRKNKLDELVLKIGVKNTGGSDKNDVEGRKEEYKAEVSTLSDMSGGVPSDNSEGCVDADSDSSRDSGKDARDRNLGLDDEAPSVPSPQLPPSSGTVGVPEQYISHLFSVYGFLRSFSICLFLSPFTLDDFVGSLNCCLPNTLLDAIHVALLRALRRHLEVLSSDGLELASKCLRFSDWSLLDTLTWPVYIVQYLTVMGYISGPQWKGFYDELLKEEYFTLPVGRKLLILQILCDDVLESAELRAEIDLREEAEVGISYDSDESNPLENRPRRVHPRYSKTSAYKDKEDMKFTNEIPKTQSCGNSFSGRGNKGDVDTVNCEVDRNSDECRLCGMDGTLICCDGCPSAYHTRCIGVMKSSVPEGSWYCPECIFNKIGPTITIGTSLKGAELFGIDTYEQIFLGTCNHLLVLNATMNAEPGVRYYNQNDIPKVLHLLYSSAHHRGLYSDICLAILQYWDIPASILPLPERTESYLKLEKIKEDANLPSLLIPSHSSESCRTTVVIKANMTSSNERTTGNLAISPDMSFVQNQVDLHSSKSNDDRSSEQCLLLNKNLPRANISSGSVSQQAKPSDLNQLNLVERSMARDLTMCPSVNCNDIYGDPVNDLLSAMPLSSQNKKSSVTLGKAGFRSANGFVYMGSFFKPYAYLNHYTHGDFAASAAARLALLSSEEARISEAHALDNPRKVISENNLQSKAFSAIASRFFWPSYEKKLVEVPRERCGWCHSCKASVSSRKGCMLNHVILSATKGAMKNLAGLRSNKSGEGSLASIATYILYIEESFRGLTFGPFLKASYRHEWRKRVDQASIYNDIRALLLELEKNIRIIAFSGDWIKLVDDCLFESSAIQSVTWSVGTTQKRGLGGRRGRKQSAICEVIDGVGHERNSLWWRGGRKSKHVFQKAILPLAMVRKAARQGGSRKIPGICYTDGFEIPRRTRQLVWKAAVERSKNASQLALQVRYLDFHLRWSDLVRPEQNLPEGKSIETEASVFRNATIRDKKVAENMIMYGITFGSQKHLPSRVMKNIIEIEKSQDGNDKFWFPETHVPLHLIREYEGVVSKDLLPLIEEPLNLLPKRRRQLDLTDIMLYLEYKIDNKHIRACCSCQVGVSLRYAIKCWSCQGYGHVDCIISSRISSNEFSFMCKTCCNFKAIAVNEIHNDSPTSPLLLQMQDYQNLMTCNKRVRFKVKTLDAHPETRPITPETQPATSDSSASKTKRRYCSWGIIWKKKNNDVSHDFRLNNVLLSGGSDVHWLKPVCILCQKPYRSDLMYLLCENCKNWYHADALELKESQIFEVVGFKCCKCRRIKSPVCPYFDRRDKMQEGKRACTRLSKREHSVVDSDSGDIFRDKKCEPAAPPGNVSDPHPFLHTNSRDLGDSMQDRKNMPLKQEHSRADSDYGAIYDSKAFEPSTPMFPMDDMSDPLLFDLASVELITEHNSEVDAEWNDVGPLPQKLPVRRHGKQKEDVDISSGSTSNAKLSSDIEMRNPMNPLGTASRHMKLESDGDDISGNDFCYAELPTYDVLSYDMEQDVSDEHRSESMEFEPQTIFTFSELLDGESFEDVPGNEEKIFRPTSEGAVPQEYEMNTFKDQTKPMAVNSSANMMQCYVCSHKEPAPDLSCENCGRWIHNHCLSAMELPSWDSTWRCIHCQEWR